MQRVLLSVILGALPAATGEQLLAVQLDGMIVRTPKLLIVLGADGLPERIAVKADLPELPLESRTAGSEVSSEVLASIGRGDQLRNPVRLFARRGDAENVAQPVKKAEPRLEKGLAIAETELRAGSIPIKLVASYGVFGRMDVALTYGAAGIVIDDFSLALDLLGPIDTVVAGNPVSDTARSYRAEEFTVGQEEGVAWVNTGEAVRRGGRGVPGVVPRLFLGNGDRGFTWLCTDPKGLVADKDVPMMVVERDQDGQFTWRIHLVNRTTKLNGPQTASFSILVHPSAAKARGHRSAAWIGRLQDPPRSDRVLDRAAGVSMVALRGPAGGDALSREQHLAATYPIALHRYLAGTHTGLNARIYTNAMRLIKPGLSPTVDRMALGRALLHDIGLAPAGVAHLAEIAAVVKALEEFGCFIGDGNTEFIPYWRSGPIVRYGEEFAGTDAFSLTEEDPLAHVHLSAWRRPHGEATKALMVVVNESPKPVRERLYVLDRSRLFGGPNQVRASQIVGTWDFSGIPKESDWNKKRMQSSAVPGAPSKASDVTLLDLVDRGFVRIAETNKNLEVYGPLYVPAYGYRILYGEGK